MKQIGNKVKVVHIHAGLDLIGSKVSMASNRNVELTEEAQGILMRSKTSNRYVKIPYGNIKGYELMADQFVEDDGSAPVEVEPKQKAPGRSKS